MSAAAELPFTGERFLPAIEGAIALEHLHRYHLAAQLADSKDVLDIASGEGYGSAILAGRARSVVGVDISEAAVRHACAAYHAVPGLRFLRGDCAAIPLPDASVDYVVSFETIEHHAAHEAMFHEIRRVLRPGGCLLISSPDKRHYSDERGFHNEFHVKELYRDEFEALLQAHFRHHRMFGQRVVYGSYIAAENGATKAVTHEVGTAGAEPQPGVVRPLYLLALASDAKLPALACGLLETPLETSDEHIELTRRLRQREGQVAGLSHAVEAKDVVIAELEGKVQGYSAAFTDRDAELNRLKPRFDEMQAQVAEMQSAQGRSVDYQLAAERLSSELGSLRDRFDASTRQLSDLVAQMKAGEERAAALDAALVSRDEAASLMQVRLATLGDEYERANTKLAEVVAVLESRDRELADRRAEWLRAERELAERAGAATAAEASSRATAEQLRVELRAVQEGRADLERRLAALHVDLRNHQLVIQQIWSSKSWRLTKGLRFAGLLTRGDWRGALGAMRRFVGLVNASNASPGVSQLTGRQVPALTDLAAPTESPAPAIPLSAPASTPAAVAPTRFPVPARRILLVSYYCPSRSHAGGLRILDLYALIKRRSPDTELHLYTHRRPTIDWSDDDVSAIFDRSYWSPTEELSYAGLRSIAGELPKYDIVDLQFHQSALDIDGYRQIGGRILFTPMESLARFLFLDARLSFQRTGRFPLGQMLRGLRSVAEEVVFSFKVDKVVCVSRTDAAFLRAVTYLRRISALETGVSDIEFEQAGANGGFIRDLDKAGRTLLYVAYFGSQTNLDALKWFLESVHPRIRERVPGYRFQVVGRGDVSSLASLVDSAVEIVGEVPRIAPYIQSARVGIAPALAGSGLRGKINQYALFGVPSVVSPLAAKGLVYRHAQDVFVAAAAKDFADYCVDLLTSDELNLTIGTRARQTCLDRYTWDSKWPAVAKLYEIPDGVQG